MSSDFKNKLALVTASTKGIGFAIANELLANGAKVIMCGSKSRNIRDASKIIKSLYDKNSYLIIKCDISKELEVLKMIKLINNKFNKPVEILVNSSGGPKVKNIIQTSYDEWKQAINSNLLSTILVTKLILPQMIKNKWGRIINLTSLTAKEPAKSMSLSNVTRAGVVAFGKTLSKELNGSGITVNNILTGAVMTERFNNLLNIRSKANNIKSSVMLKKIIKDIPSGYIASPDEFAKIILFLCSKEANYLNGVALNIDGGIASSNF
jgi:3-oxoacyl-[acyl-carrier protein] reductase